LKKAYDSIRGEVLYSIVFEFGKPSKLAGLIKNVLNESYSTGKNISYKFPIQNGLKKETFYHHCFSTLLWNTPPGESKRTRKGST
jgi:hypothetical protein